MKIVIEDKELIKESKEYLKSLLKKSAHFYTIASDEDMDSIIEGTIEECWFFTGKVTIEEDFNNLKNKVSSRLPRKQNGELYDVYKLWSEIDYKFIENLIDII